jgi:hypothetical protein
MEYKILYFKHRDRRRNTAEVYQLFTNSMRSCAYWRVWEKSHCFVDAVAFSSPYEDCIDDCNKK